MLLTGTLTEPISKYPLILGSSHHTVCPSAYFSERLGFISYVVITMVWNIDLFYSWIIFHQIILPVIINDWQKGWRANSE